MQIFVKQTGKCLSSRNLTFSWIFFMTTVIQVLIVIFSGPMVYEEAVRKYRQCQVTQSTYISESTTSFEQSLT